MTTATSPVPAGGTSEPAGAGLRNLSTDDVVEYRIKTWQNNARSAAGQSAMQHLDALGDAYVDLTTAHPGGIAQLFASGSTRLSALFREQARLSAARTSMRAVSESAAQVTATHAVASCSLVLGVANWTETRPAETDEVADSTTPPPPPVVEEIRAPVLLRPLRLENAVGDISVELAASVEINPILVRALRSRGALLDANTLVSDCFGEHGFTPWQVLERIEAVASAVLPSFTMDRMVVIGSFVSPLQIVADDLDQLNTQLSRHPVVRALAGDTESVAMPADGQEIEFVPDYDPDPHTEQGLGDLSAVERHAYEIASQGHHLFIEAPQGASGLGVAGALISDIVRSGGKAAVVSGQRRTAREVIGLLSDAGLADSILDLEPSADWQQRITTRLLQAMTLEPGAVDHNHLHAIREELKLRADQLTGYMAALHRQRAPWGVSAFDALEALAELASQRPAPTTRVRLPRETARELDAERRREVTAQLHEVAALGEFSRRVRSQAWYGANISTEAEANDALERVVRLLDDSLPTLSLQMAQVSTRVGLTTVSTLDQWRAQLSMLAGMRETLDTFLPLVYERSVQDMIAATAPRTWREEHNVELSSIARRRLRKQALDMVRPGSHVEDLHAALLKIQRQREQWQDNCPAGGWPTLPEGLRKMEALATQIAADLVTLNTYLATTGQGSDLHQMDLAQLHDRLVRLRTEKTALENLPDRTVAVRELRDLGLSELIQDLSDRKVDIRLIGSEVEQAWWNCVLDAILTEEPALGTYDGAALDAISRRFSELDRAHLGMIGLQARHDMVQSLVRTLTVHRGQAEQVFGDLVEGRLGDIKAAMARYPEVLPALRPVLVGSPALMAQVVPPVPFFDLVVLSDVDDLPLPTLLGVIARARQVVMIADLARESTTATEFVEVLPRVRLEPATTERDLAVSEFLDHHEVKAGSFGFPQPVMRTTLHHVQVDGRGIPDPQTGSVLSTQAEADKVIELIIDHALLTPDESLAVIAGNADHASRIQSALTEQISQNGALQKFFANTAASDIVFDIAHATGLRRQAIIFSVGFGRTPHGRVLHRFGAISSPKGRDLILNAVSASTRRLTTVSAFSAEELDEARLRSDGALLLREVLQLTTQPRAKALTSLGMRAPEEAGDSEPEPLTTHARLLLDLADRLWREGLDVELDFGLSSSRRIPMVIGHPQLPDRLLVAVLVDDEAYTSEPSVRVRERQTAELLEDLGWSVAQVWSTALFLDPAREAQRIKDLTLEAAEEHMLNHQPPPPPADVPIDLADDVDGALFTDPAFAPAAADAGAPTPAHVAQPPLALTLDLSGPPAEATLRPGVRPNILPGLPISAYGDNDLDDIILWLQSTGESNDPEHMGKMLRAELGVTRRSTRVDLAIDAALRRAGLL